VAEVSSFSAFARNEGIVIRILLCTSGEHSLSRNNFLDIKEDSHNSNVLKVLHEVKLSHSLDL